MIKQADEVVQYKQQLMELTDGKDSRSTYLYVVKPDPMEPDSNCQVKVGKTRDCSKRHGAYKQITPNAILLLSMEVSEDHITKAETLLKHLLSISCIRISSEVFRGSADSIKMWTTLVADIFRAAETANVGCLQAFHDAGNEHIRNRQAEHLQPSDMKLLRETLARLLPQTADTIATTQPPAPPAPAPAQLPTLSSPAKEPYERAFDFNRFLDECCVLGEDSKVTSVSIVGRHRTWAGYTNKKLQHAFNEFLRTRFLPKRYTDNGENRHGFAGVEIIEFKRPESIVPGAPERFCLQCCVDSSASRVYLPHLRDAFFKWQLEVEGITDRAESDIEALHAYLKQFYVIGELWCATEKVTLRGFYGICIKGNEERHTQRAVTSTCRVVKLVDPETGELKRKFDKVSEAAEYLSKSTSYISRAVRNRLKPDGYIVQYG